MSTHWIRYTTLTWVERRFGYAVARAFAGHFGKGDAGTTTTYVRATIEELATALAALTNEEHPLAAISFSLRTARLVVTQLDSAPWAHRDT